MPQIYCRKCKGWVRVPRDETIRGARVDHQKLCPGEPMNHPDLMELDAQMEYWFGD